MVSGPVKRITVDLSDYPDLVVVYLGMRIESAPRTQDIIRAWVENPECCPSQSSRSVAARDFPPFPFFPRTSACVNTGAIFNR